MKKQFALLITLCIFSHTNTKRRVYARSFMYTKPAYLDMQMIEASWHNIEFNKKGSLKSGIQFIPFFQESISQNKTAEYFLMNGKTELLVSGDANIADKEIRDIRAEWLNLPNNFRGFLSLNPKQKQAGCVLEFNQDLKHWLDYPVIRDMYLRILMPIMIVKNNIHLSQNNVINKGTNTDQPQDIIQAFNQPSWIYSRIPNGKSRSGVPELKIMIGTAYMSEDDFQLNYYSTLAIPTGNKQNGQTMFQPVNGNNHHLGIGAGVTIQVPITRDLSNYSICFLLDLESIILIRNKQFRTYDVFDKEWSRFILMNKIGAQPKTNVPGVNLMTQRITAKPFNVVDFAAGWRLKKGKFEGELGYGIWGHGNERTNLNQPFTEVFGFAGSGPGKTASKSTIAQQAEDDDEFVPITKSDLNPQSGESFGGFSQRAYLSLGWINKGIANDIVIGGGFSADIPFHNSLLELWKVWLKVSITF